jgi:hypothetical protein
MKLSKELARQALKRGICKEWYDRLLTLDNKRAMVEMYLAGIDFCLANDYPSNDFIRSHFADVIHEKGIWLDNHIRQINPPRLVALGATHGDVILTGHAVSDLFIKHNASIVLRVEDHTFARIDIFDDARLEVQATGNAKAVVNVYGNATVDHSADGEANIKVVHRNKRTY